MRIGELLEKNGIELHTIACSRTVEDAIVLMAQKKSSALIVLQGQRPVGVLSERDVLLSHLKYKGRAFGEIRIDDALTNKLIAVESAEKVSSCLSMMIHSGINHLPVIENERIIGMLCLGTLVRHRVEELTAEIDLLQQYIDDLHEGGQD